MKTLTKNILITLGAISTTAAVAIPTTYILAKKDKEDSSEKSINDLIKDLPNSEISELSINILPLAKDGYLFTDTQNNKLNESNTDFKYILGINSMLTIVKRIDSEDSVRYLFKVKEGYENKYDTLFKNNFNALVGSTPVDSTDVPSKWLSEKDISNLDEVQNVTIVMDILKNPKINYINNVDFSEYAPEQKKYKKVSRKVEFSWLHDDKLGRQNIFFLEKEEQIDVLPDGITV